MSAVSPAEMDVWAETRAGGRPLPPSDYTWGGGPINVTSMLRCLPACLLLLPLAAGKILTADRPAPMAEIEA
eukprot:COSAG01_NODE_2758_length_7121_cov_64.907434_1_plen_72_part_00